MKQVASLTVTILPDGEITVPVTLAAKVQQMALDIGDPYSYLRASYADAEGFAAKPMPRYVEVEDRGGKADGIVTVPTFSLGGASGKDLQLLRFTEGDGSGPVGKIAMDILSNFDVEIDLSSHVINLYTHDHCEGKVVYWPAESYAEVPYRTDPTGHPMFRMELDGKPLVVGLSMNPGGALMGMTAAQRLFGIDENMPGLTLVANTPPEYPKIYRYPFKTLSVEGVTIRSPAIELYPNTPEQECQPYYSNVPDHRAKRCYGGADLMLGQSEMRALHLFFATKEKMLYVTAADNTPTPLTGAKAN